ADKEQDVPMPTAEHFSDAEEEMLIESETELSNNTSKEKAVEKNNCEIEASDKAEDYILPKKSLEEAPFTTVTYRKQKKNKKEQTRKGHPYREAEGSRSQLPIRK
ncbi:9616_t:CDS:1, partial [Cetraspora pellucida]